MTVRQTRRRALALAFALLLVIVATAVGIGTLLGGSNPSATDSGDGRATAESTALEQPTGQPLQASHGFVPDGTALSPTDDVPAITRLDPDLRHAAQLAFDDAARNGVGLSINSGWRSRALQQHLLDQAITQYGSREEALKWVSTPEASHHTSGRAIDVGPIGNVDWLDSQGYRFGLCRTYDNEQWHFELATRPGTPCPPRLPSAAAAGG